MRTLFVTSAALFVAVGVAAGEKTKLKSGLQPGAKAGPFNVLDCTGPNKGKKLCYR